MDNKFQALKWLWTGKKVRLKGWPEGKFLILTQSQKIINNAGFMVDINDLDGEWVAIRKKIETLERIDLTKEQIKLFKKILCIKDIDTRELSDLIGRGKNAVGILIKKKSMTKKAFIDICNALDISMDKFFDPNVTIKDFI